MEREIVHLVPKSGILVNGTTVSEDEEKALVTVEAYRISFEGSLKKRKLVTLLGVVTAGIGALTFLQTGNTAMAGGLIGAGVAMAVLAQVVIKPHPIKFLSKVHVPLLLLPYRGGKSRYCTRLLCRQTGSRNHGKKPDVL